MLGLVGFLFLLIHLAGILYAPEDKKNLAMFLPPVAWFYFIKELIKRIGVFK